MEKTFGTSYVQEVKNLTVAQGIFIDIFISFLLSDVPGWPRVIKYDALYFFTDIRKAKFNFAPVGAAIDSHRAWESIMLGTIPIVHDTTLNGIFEGLPALILPDITVTNQTFLEDMYVKMKSKEYDWNRLFGFYWIMKVRRATYLDKHPIGPSVIYPPTLPPPPPTPPPPKKKPIRQPKTPQPPRLTKKPPPNPTPTPFSIHNEHVKAVIQKVRERLAKLENTV